MTLHVQWICNILLVFGQAAPAGSEQDQPPPTPTPEIQIDSGKIRGLVVGDEKNVYAYKGIPFAKPPVGDLRWRPPVNPDKWSGVRDCFEFGNACPQRTPAMMKAIPQMAINAPTSEDCLYLNVWTPAERGKEKLPVLVWIHGGGYTMGAASQPIYDGRSLASKGAVVVSTNYRLGPFGFLAHPALSKESKQAASGNYGIMDQVEALRWVQRNVESFGGDPNRVLIFGESAGGGSILCLMVCPQAKGLFHAAVAQSAPEMNLAHLRKSTGDRPSAEEQGVQLIEKCGLTADPTAEEMRSLDADKLVEIFPALEVDRKFELELGGLPLPIGPIVDGHVIPDEPNAVFAADKAHPVPMMIGNTRDEMTMFFMQTPTPKEVDAYRKEIAEDFGDLAPQVEAAYPATDAKSIRDAVIHLVSDVVFGSQARYAARLHAQNGHPTYRYVFSRGSKQFPLSAMGAHHACEIAFLFGQPANPDETDRKVVDWLQGYWINFASKGDPNGEGLPHWPKFSTKDDALVEIENDVAVREKHRDEQLNVIDKYRGRKPVSADAARAN